MERGTAIKEGTIKATLWSILHDALTEGKAVSLWRLPNSNDWNLIVANETTRADKGYSIEDSKPGFLISPFDPSAPKYFLAADAHFVVSEQRLEQRSGPEVSLGARPQSSPLPFHTHPAPTPAPVSENAFEQLVARCIGEIEKGRAEKLVPSRHQETTIEPGADLINLFEKLCFSYPQAFVSLVSGPPFGTWIGASPELLVHVDRDLIFRTAALASTQEYREHVDLKTVSWNQKEIEEQALVGRYIINCFKKIRLREFDEHGPRTIRAGNLLHLKTDFSVDMRATNFPQLGTVMLQLLHPTSAVCGMPLEPSLEFLLQNEQYDRQLYSGFVGPVNIELDSQLFVNLRCMKVNGTKGTLYAGAGVTVDSIPSMEWDETVMKMNTLLQIVHSKT